MNGPFMGRSYTTAVRTDRHQTLSKYVVVPSAS
jgi:hypothetical protein